jgi:hypothetical protein
MNRFHKISAIFCALLSSHVYGAPASLDGLIPVAFSQFRSSMPDEKASRIVHSMSAHLRKTLVDVYATEMIGSASDFSPKLAPAILGSSGYALGEIDRTIEMEVIPEIRQTLASLSDHEKISLDIEVLWAKRTSVEHLPQSSFLSSALVAAMRVSGRVDAASLLSLRWLDVDEIDRSGDLRASLRSTEMLHRLAVAKPGQWMPFQTSIRFLIDRSGIHLDHDGLLLPAGFQKNEKIHKPGILIDRVVYAPRSVKADSEEDEILDLSRVTFKRKYTAQGVGQLSGLRVAFGTWENHQFQVCEGSVCLDRSDQIPTIHGKVVFSETTWWESFIGWFRSWVISEIETKILLKDLHLSYDRNTHKIAVEPSRSVIPIIVKTDALLSGGQSFMLDDRSGVFGVNLYERFVGSQITEGLSADLNKSIVEADKALSGVIAGVAGGVIP